MELAEKLADASELSRTSVDQFVENVLARDRPCRVASRRRQGEAACDKGPTH